MTAVTLAALTAVAFWSLKPIFISIIGDRGDFAEVYVTAASISVLVSAIGATVLWRRTARLFRGGRTSLSGVGSAMLSGFFLALWYYGYYRALYSVSKVDATVIAFTWPLISVIAMRVFSPKTARKLKFNEWLMVAASFVGACAIGISNAAGGHTPSGSDGEIVWAFVAALGSGLYLPFAINATKSFDRILSSRAIATFYSISVANVAALVVVLTALGASAHKLRFYAFDPQVIFVCALIGIGTYLIAEITWTWAFQEYESLTLSSLPYFSPAVSVVLLYLIFDEPVRPIAVVGLVLILFSNLTLHARHRSTNALSLALIATVYVALGAQILPNDILTSVPDMATALTGLFAILAGFILSQVSNRRTQEQDARATLARRLIATDESADKDRADELLQFLIELEFDRTDEGKEKLAQRMKEALSRPGERRTPAQESALDAFSTWLTIHLDRLSIGEQAALWLTGLSSIIFVLLLRGDSALGNAGAIAFAAGAFLALFAIRDYDRNNIHGFTSQILRLQQGFREIGKKYYLPVEILDSGELSGRLLRRGVRTRHDDDRVRLVESLPSSRTFNAFYLGTAALLILAVMLMPTVFRGGIDAATATSPHPGETTVLPGGRGATVTIADPGWPGGSVAAEVLKQVLESADVSARVESIDHVDAVSEMGSENPGVHVHPDLWVQNQDAAVRDWISDETISLSGHSYPGTQGIYVLDAPGTDSVSALSDLADPDLGRKFDSDDDGKAELWIGPRAWSSTERLASWLDEGNGEGIEGESYSETIFKARLVAEAEDRNPLLFYGYEPDGIHQEFSTRLLAPMPGGAEDNDEVDVHVAWSSSLAAVSPEAARILRAVDFSQDDLSGFIAAVQLDEKSPRKVAKDWISDNSDRVTRWQQSD
ncbi:glycine betaine ABC transporter substrate-binding protein [Nocardioides sp. NPDC057772]|uniref:glycine betaine ABC transporter substrate-binding protein n=1 Tax=Nocardioides sp. NPDC057772 TaxID=3346245 RepID=UPI00366DE5E0